MTITLPEPLRRFVEEQVAKGRYDGPSEYLATLIHREREAALAPPEPDEPADEILTMLGLTQEELEAKLLEGLRGPSRVMTSEDWVALKQRIIDRSPELREER